MTGEILVLCSCLPDMGLVSRAAVLAKRAEMEVRAVVFDKRIAAEASQYGADKMEMVLQEQDCADDYRIAEWIGKRILEEWNSEIILAPSTIRFRTIMPILAVFLDAGLTADCTEIDLNENGRLIQVRPASGNQLMARIETTGKIQMATVRSGIYPLKLINGTQKKEITCGTEWTGNINRPDLKGKVKVIGFEPFVKMMPLSQAEIIFAGGKGIGSRENFMYFSELASRAGAAVGASRMAVDAGYAPYSCQIGQTGSTVHPHIYVAAGISGAVHHLAGMSGSDIVIAINTDTCAPVFRYADYGIVGDWREVLERVVESLEHTGKKRMEEIS